MKKKYSFKEAAVKILKEENEALSADMITSLALEKGLLDTDGKTPAATMAAQLYTDINRNRNSMFVKVGKGKFALSGAGGGRASAEQTIEIHNKGIVDLFRKKLHEYDPLLFEQLIADLLNKIGYENVQTTKRSGDGGIDVVANLRAHGLTNVKTVVQVKRYQHNVADKVVRELRGGAEVDQRGLIIATSDFTKPAIDEANAPNKIPIALVNGDKLVELLVKYRVGIQTELREVYSIDELYFSTLEKKEIITVGAEKKLSVWPLPGGIKNYVNALNNILQAIGSGGMDKAKMVEWFKSSFENVESEKTIYGYLGVLRVFGLTKLVGSRLELTDIANKYLKRKSKTELFDIINERIFGFDEVLEFIKESNEPQSESDVRDYLNNNFEVDWKSTAQTSYRLLWLWNLDLIHRTDDGRYQSLAT